MSARIHVLHVDDEPEFAEVTAEILTREDDQFVVETATSASEGLDRLAEVDFDCVVSDYDMPRTDGIQFLELVREEYPDLPFILFTGKGSEAVASDAISSGVTDYLQKGSGTETYAILSNRIRNVVESYRSQQALAERNRELRKYERMVNTMQEAACIYDPDGQFDTVNQYLADWYGHTREELEGQHSNLVSHIRAQGETDQYEELLDGERQEIHGELTDEFPGHGYAVIEYRLTPLTVDGTVEGAVGIARDITEHREREQELFRRKRAMDEAPAGITITDPEQSDNPIIYANARFRDLTGYPTDEIRGRNCRFLQGDSTDPEPVAAMREAIDNEERVTVELRNYRRDGTEFWTRVSIAPVYSDDGSLVNYVGFQQDVTERKERDRELERTRDLLKQTERIADVGGWEIDPDTRDVFWTENLFELLGVEDGEEPPLEEALDVYFEEDRPRVAEAVERALEDGTDIDVDARFRRPDGEVRWLHILGTPVIEDGDVVSLRGAVQDTTDLQRREHILQELYAVVADREQSFDDKVEALLELGRDELDTQYGTLSEIRGEEYVFKHVSADDDSIQAGDVVPVEATNCETVARTEEALALGDVERDAPDETDRTGFTDWEIACYIGAPLVVDGDIYGTFCFYDTDARPEQFSEWEQTLVDLMSQWVSYELQRRAATDRLQAQNEQLEQFTSIVSHDLRNPLKVAEGRLELAQAECDSEHLGAIGRAHDRMRALIEDLLTLAREGEAEYGRSSLESVVEECWTTVNTGEASLHVETDRTIQADLTRLGQVFENLFRNAVEHGGDDVTVVVGELDGGFYVEDDGPGIAEDERDAVFEAGYSTATAGTGLGLSIVTEIIDAHGWQIRLTEGSEGGARFEITQVGVGTD